jgi:MSHA biogenesis protein MshJ
VNSLSKRWSAFSIRERIILMVLLPMLIVVLADLLYAQPQDRAAKRLLSQATNLEADNGRLQEQIEQLRAKLKGHSVSELTARQQQLGEALQRQRQQIRAVTEALIPPEAMAGVLQTMLEKRGKLNLVSLENLPAEPVEGPDSGQGPKGNEQQGGNSAQAAKQEPLLYRHPIRIRVRGRYFDVVRYLKSLETLKHKFFWDQLKYHVDRYPVADVELVLSTLGTDAYLMGAGNVVPMEAAHD